MNITEVGCSPVYLNLSPQDVDELTEGCWDTLRILVVSDTKELCVASGYGNTHSSMVHRLQAHKKLRRVHTEDSIVYFDSGTAYVNDSYSDQGDKIPARKWNILYQPEHEDMIKLLCTERGLRLS